MRDAGVTADQAEAHAEAARDFVMHELVTRYDLQAVKDELETVRRELDAKIEFKTKSSRSSPQARAAPSRGRFAGRWAR